MTKVLAVRTADGHYFELATLRVKTEDGDEVSVKLNDAVFAQVLDVKPSEARSTNSNGSGAHTIGGVGGIRSEERVNGLG